MNKRISDLLDAYGSDIELKPETPLSSERIKALTMIKIKETAPQKRRVTFRLLAAAAIIAAFAISTVAAGSGGAWFQAFFAEKNESGLTDAQIAAIEQNAVPIGQSRTVEGYTVTVESAMNDGRNIYIKLDLYAPEGEVLAYEERRFEQMTLYNQEGVQVSSGWRFTDTIDEDKTDNHDEMLLSFEIEEDNGLSGGAVLKLTDLYKIYGRPFEQKKEMMAAGTWTFDLAFSAGQADSWEYEVIRNPVPCNMVKYHTDEETEIILTSICLRALTIDVVYDYPDGADLEHLRWLGMKLIRTDGTAISVLPSDSSICPDGDQVTGYVSLEPDAPIVLDEIAWIEFPGGTRIPVNKAQ